MGVYGRWLGVTMAELTSLERATLKRKLEKSTRLGDGYKARIAAIQRRLDEADMKDATDE